MNGNKTEPQDAPCSRDPLEHIVAFVGGSDSDSVSEVLEEYHSFSDESISIRSEKSFMDSYRSSMQGDVDRDYDLLSTASTTDSKAQHQIRSLKNRLRIQEDSKLELLNQCLKLERKLEDYERRLASLQECRAQNRLLSETNAKMEHDFMNAMNEIVNKMAEEEAKYSEALQRQEETIKQLDQELRLSKGSLDYFGDDSPMKEVDMNISLT